MKKLVLFLILALGYMVCFAAPPPDNRIQTDDVSFVAQQSIDLLVATPCIIVQDQQPAPLLISRHDLWIKGTLTTSSLRLHLSAIAYNSQNYTQRVNSKLGRIGIPVINNSSGGLPY